MNWHKGKRAIARAIRLDLTHQQEHYAHCLEEYVHPGDRWLDIGCGHDILPDWAMPLQSQEALVQSVNCLVGLDLDDSMLRHAHLTHRVWGNGEALPFRDASFDIVTANMVVEHIEHPQNLLSSIAKVLRPGGRFLFVTPNVLCPYLLAAWLMPEPIKRPIVRFLESRRDEDIFPTRYRMNKLSVIAQMAEQTGFATEELKTVGSCGELDRLGPLSWAECLVLKGLQSSFDGILQPDIIAVLKKRDIV